METVQCKMCGKIFESRRHTRLYCEKCAHQRKVECGRNYYRKYYVKRKKKSSPEEQKFTSLVTQKINAYEHKKTHHPICMNCGRDFEPTYTGEKYCSEECYAQSPLRKIYARNPRALNFLVSLLLGESWK